MSERKSVRYRRNDWFDEKTGSVYYGVDALPISAPSRADCHWMHVAQNGKPLFFPTTLERDNWVTRKNRCTRKPAATGNSAEEG